MFRAVTCSAASAVAAAGAVVAPAIAEAREPRWALEADVVVIGAGAMGLPAAIVARRQARR